VRRLALAGALALAAVVRFYTVASAHVTLVSTRPAANSTLAASPTSIRLEFSEPMEPAVAHVILVSPDGHSTPLSLTNDPHDAHFIVGTTSNLGAGTYRVEWHVLSEDGHPVGGSFVFSIGAATTPPPPTSSELVKPAWGPSIAGAPLIPSVLRGLGVGSLAALAGLLFYLVTTRTGLESRPGRVALWFSIVTPMLLAGHLIAWAINAAPDYRLTTDWLSSAFSTTAGRMELWRALLSLLPLWALVFARRGALALGATVPSLVLSAAVGHSIAFQPSLSVPLKLLHFVALAGWVGGLLWLVVSERRNAEQFAADAGRVSSIALWSVMAITISGALQVVILIPHFADLWSPYGATVLTKVIGLGVLVAFGAYHRRTLTRLPTDRDGSVALGFRTTLRREIAVLWLVVLLGGFLGYVSPPASATTGPSNAQESSP
jgi:copper transport protein